MPLNYLSSSYTLTVLCFPSVCTASKFTVLGNIPNWKLTQERKVLVIMAQKKGQIKGWEQLPGDRWGMFKITQPMKKWMFKSYFCMCWTSFLRDLLLQKRHFNVLLPVQKPFAAQEKLIFQFWIAAVSKLYICWRDSLIIQEWCSRWPSDVNCLTI